MLTDDEILKMSRDAGIINKYGGRECPSNEQIANFAAAAFAAGAADEREAVLSRLAAERTEALEGTYAWVTSADQKEDNQRQRTACFEHHRGCWSRLDAAIRSRK